VANPDYLDINGQRLGPLEIRWCMVEIMAGPKPEAVPEERNRYARDLPISTDVHSCNQISVSSGAMFR
jgi:hypothetical protein